MLRRRSLGGKIGIFCGSLILLAVILVSGLAYIYSSKILVNQAEDMLITSATQASDLLELQLQAELEALAGIAERWEIKTMNWQVQKNVLVPETERLQNFISLGISDKNGFVQYHDGQTANLGDRDYIQKALAGEPAISDILVSRVTNELVMMYAIPIKDSSGVLGALVARKPGTALSDMIAGLGFGQSGWAYVFGTDGRVFAYQDEQLVLDQVSIFDETSPYYAVGREVEKLGRGKSGIIRYTLDDQLSIVGLSPVESTNWTIAVGAREDEVLAGVKQLGYALILIAVAVSVAGALLVTLIGRRLTRPLRDIEAIMGQVASGNLSGLLDVKSEDEVGKVSASINKSMENIRGVLQLVSEAVNTLARTSADMAAASEEVTASIEEVASTTNQFSSTLDQMHANAQVMSSTSQEVSDHAAAGEQALEAIVGQMHDLRVNTDELADKVNTVGASSKKIGEIVNTINDIAEQTNLLALNAAIEAARAGEHGRGFAVVADEVRKLAEQSAQATAEIAALVRQTQSDIEAAVKEMHEESAHVEQLLSTVRTSEEELHKILVAVNQMTSQIEELTQGLTEVNTGGHEIASATEEQAASIQEIASSAHDLTEMAEKLKQQTDFFTLDQ